MNVTGYMKSQRGHIVIVEWARIVLEHASKVFYPASALVGDNIPTYWLQFDGQLV